MNYDYSYFHPDCPGKTVVSSPEGIFVVCPTCHVVANLEAVSAKISPADVIKVGKGIERVLLGKMSPEVKR